MKFSVTGLSDIVCDGCGGTTRVAPNKTYNTDDLTCNCNVGVISDNSTIVNSTPDDEAESTPRENPNQLKMFNESPEHVVNPDEAMEEPEVRKYLEGLQWQELLTAGKNNDVTKPPSADREELIKLIIAKVFHE